MDSTSAEPGAGDVRDLLAAWALDAVDDVERARIERAIRDDPELAREARSLVETASRLAETSALRPPPALRAGVLSAVAVTPQHSAATSAPTRGRTSGPRSRAVFWVAAAAFATIGVAAPTVLAIQQAGRAVRAEQQVALFADALARPGAQVVAGEVAGGGHAVAVLTESGAVFAARGLSRLEAERAYQLWVIDGGDPEPAGVLPVSGGTVQVEVGGGVPGATLAVTIEPAGGSLQPTTEPVVVLTAQDSTAPPADQPA